MSSDHSDNELPDHSDHSDDESSDHSDNEDVKHSDNELDGDSFAVGLQRCHLAAFNRTIPLMRPPALAVRPGDELADQSDNELTDQSDNKLDEVSFSEQFAIGLQMCNLAAHNLALNLTRPLIRLPTLDEKIQCYTAYVAEVSDDLLFSYDDDTLELMRGLFDENTALANIIAREQSKRLPCEAPAPDSGSDSDSDSDSGSD